MLDNVKIATRLYAGFGLLLAFIVALWGVSRWGVASLRDDTLRTLAGDVEIMEHADRARANALGLRRFEKDMFLNIDSAPGVEKYYKSWNDEKEKINARIADLEKRVVLPGDQQALKEIKANMETYLAGVAKTYQRIKAGEIKTPQEGNQAMAEFKEATHQAVAKTQNLAAEIAKRVAGEGERLDQLSNRIGNIILAINIVALLAGALVAMLIARSIAVPLGLLRNTIAQVETSGDFTLRVPVHATDEVGETAKSFNELLAALQQTLGQVLDSSDKVADAARSLSSASQQVAAGSTQQSEASSSMAAAIEEMTVSINHVSGSARDALEFSRKAGQLSADGGRVIQETAAEMSLTANTVSNASQAIAELGEQSNRISSIVQVIKDVADQTNLLALNAAIEAARAGEQGRGFAVVADEVRKLAERTSSATGEITQMISSMQQGAQAAVSSMGAAVGQVSSGVKLANQAGSAIVEIKAGAEQVVNVVNDISSALAEQSSASNEIASQVEKVAQMTEENTAAAAESASAADCLRELAGAMHTTVSRFKI